MVINYLLHFPFLLIHLLKHFNYFLDNEICLERVLQPFTIYVLFRISCGSLPPVGSFAEFQPRLPIPEALCWKHVWNTRSATAICLPPRPRPSGYPKIHSYESSRLIRILPKTEECSGSLCGSSESLADDLNCIPHIPYISMKSCINTKPSLLQNNHLFTP